MDLAFAIDLAVESGPGLAKVQPPVSGPAHNLALRILELRGVVAKRVLAATDSEELNQILDEGISEEWPGQRAAHEALHAAVYEYLDAVGMPEAESSFGYADVVSQRAARLLREARRIQGLVSRTIEEAHAVDRDAGPDRQIEVPPLREPLWFLRLHIPSEIGRAFMAKGRGSLARLALHHAVDSERVLPEWLGVDLATEVLRGERESLRLLAAQPAFSRLQDEVPVSERLDWSAIAAREELRTYQLEKLMEEAERSGDSVYPRFDPEDD